MSGDTHNAATTERRLRVPRASLAVTILDDEDYLVLADDSSRCASAFGVFTLLVIAAKKLRNRGRFVNVSAASRAVCLDRRTVALAVESITTACRTNKHDPWLYMDGESLVIRTFGIWNAENRGGERPGAGRPPKSKRNQTDSKAKSKACAPVSVTGPDVGGEPPTTPRGTLRAAANSRPRNPHFDALAAAFYPTGHSRRIAKAIGACAADLKAMQADPDDVESRRENLETLRGRRVSMHELVQAWNIASGEGADIVACGPADPDDPRLRRAATA